MIMMIENCVFNVIQKKPNAKVINFQFRATLPL